MENNTVTQTETSNSSEVAKHKEKVIGAPLLIIFAEYLGYVSRFNQIAIDWCEGKEPEDYVKKLITMESKSIFRQMKKDYGIETIQFWYDTYYPVILAEYEEKLAKAVFHIQDEDED